MVHCPNSSLNHDSTVGTEAVIETEAVIGEISGIKGSSVIQGTGETIVGLNSVATGGRMTVNLTSAIQNVAKTSLRSHRKDRRQSRRRFFFDQSRGLHWPRNSLMQTRFTTVSRAMNL